MVIEGLHIGILEINKLVISNDVIYLVFGIISGLSPHILLYLKNK